MSSARLPRHIGLLLVACVFVSSPSLPQSQSGTAAGTVPPTFKSTVPMVLLDVVVTNKKDEPVMGLKKGQFQVFEDGTPQRIESFEEHAGITDVPELSRMAKLPPDVFSNVPLAKAGEAANVLLLDSLNTEMADQSYVHAQMIKYIKDIHPGTRLAIFTLSDRLRFVQGFTEDPALLLAAVNGKKSGGNPELSSLLQTSSEQNAHQQLVGQMQKIGAQTGDPGIAAAANSLGAFLAENTSSQNGVRANLTLEAINQLAMYLQAIPGRKNVIWFTGSFPLNTLSTDPNMLRDYGPDVANTANLLATARIAIYPIGVGAMGLAPNAMYDASAPTPAKITGARTATLSQVQTLDQESTSRAQNSASLEEMANNTGGQAFLHTSGFNQVLDHVVKTGTYYYTLTYSPTNRTMDGRLRHIQVTLSDGKYHVAYRRGYYGTNDFMVPALKPAPKGDPLRPLMEHGTPDSTAILYTMKVVPASAQPRTLEAGAVSQRAGDNQKLSGAVTRYTVTFAIPPEHLALHTSADGVHHGSVETTLLAYDRYGTPVNWMARLVQIRVARELYAQAQANGVGFNLDIDVPTSGVYLRSGLYEMASNQAGTLEIPLAAVVASPAPTHNAADHPPASVPPAPPANANLAVPTAGTNVPVPASSGAPGPNPPATLALAAAKELEEIDVPKYCTALAASQEHSSSLAAVCEFVLSLRKKLTNIICDRETKRYWTPNFGTDTVERSNVITVDVSYRDGQEFDNNVRVDGKPVSGDESGLSGSWSHGEFSTMLAAVFTPSSKAEFHSSKETKLHSIPALVFDFKVAAQNNRLYFLDSSDKVWFPEYKGKIWIDARTSSLLRLELETAHTPHDPITRTKDDIEYSNLVLGDGTRMVLPTNSKALICTASCTRIVTEFKNWHKFRATTNIVVNPSD